MRIIFLPKVWTILLCFLVWPVLQYGAAWVCLHLPDRRFNANSVLFRYHGFEQAGRLYDRLFRVRCWKHLLPDGSIGPKQGRFIKKHLESFSEDHLRRFLLESARAELTHWLAILPFPLFGLLAPPRVMGYMLIYALLVNLPCIIAQRYNRPRVLKLLNRMASEGRRQTIVKEL